METTYKIIDDFDARCIYRRLKFYSRDAHNSNKVKFGELKFERLEYDSDNLKHDSEKETLDFIELGTRVKLNFKSYPCEHPEGKLATHILEIEILGEEQANKDTVRKLETITGTKIA